MSQAKNFTDRLARHIVLGDGAMGTMLYEHGVFLNACFDELNLTNPALVQGIHAAYVNVGVDFIETNTFGANEFKLAKFGLADKVDAINHAAVHLARQAAEGAEVMIAGAVGPLGYPLEPYGGLTRQQAQPAFRTQINALIQAGVDLLIFETFTNPDELRLALDTAAALSCPPIIAQLTTNEYHETIYGQKLTDAIALIAQHPAAAAVGLNCAIGPAIMLSSLELIRTVTDKPISLQPNAGLPREIEGRKIYMSTPEYLAEYAKKFFEKGARILGGCCGTTPAHIDQIIRAVRALDKATVQKPALRVTIVSPAAPQENPALPLEQKSPLGRKLATGQEITTIEITPPRGADLTSLLDKARLCATHHIDAINIPDGPRASSRISPLATAVAIQQHTDLQTILHVCCRDRNIIGMQSDILGAYAIGLRNLLLITGDPPKLGEYPDATAVFDLDSIGLTAVVANLNRGLDIGGNTFSPPVALTIGVGANPVAADLTREIDRFKQKVDAGAEYAVTQPVFDADMLFRFLDATASHAVPIIAGIWPFTSYKNAEFMAREVPGVVVPDNLLARMSIAQTRDHARRLGIDIAREMIRTVRPRVAGFAVSAPFGNVHTALAVLGKIAP